MEHAEAIAKLLGGSRTFAKKPRSDKDFITIVRTGLPVRSVAYAARALSLSEQQTFELLRIPKRTAARRQGRNERLRQVESERLLRLARVAVAATDVFGTRAKAIRWLKKPNRALSGEVPILLLDTDIGFQNVLEFLHRIEYGVFN